MMNQIHKLFVLGLFFACFNNVSMSQACQSGFSDQVIAFFNSQVMRLPQEKLYLQTDKPYYSAGEDIWFKGYLVNAITHTPMAQSKFIYVELINQADSVYQRIKIRKDSLGFVGKIKLSAEIPFGYYTLRAYSYWMRNTGDDFFFRKQIFIGNPIDDAIKGSIFYSKPLDGVFVATIRFTNARKEPIANKKVLSMLDWTGNKLMKATGVTNANGSVSFPIKLDNSSFKNKSMEVSFADNQSTYHQKFILPSFEEDFDLQFFPEGGTLLSDCFQTVAFKVIGSDGLSVEMTGNVVDSLGEELCKFESTHKGMGKFFMYVQPNKVYYVNAKTAKGFEKKFKFGPAKNSGIILQLKHNRGKIIYEIINRTDLEEKSLCLLIHTRGEILLFEELSAQTLSGKLSESILHPGITSFSVVNQLTSETLTERLAFVFPSTAYTIKMKTDKAGYDRRENVMLNFNLLDKDSIPVKGNFSLSVTDNFYVIQDSLADNIMTNLLLTSDLKGYIEDPGAYFIDASKETQEKLDILMLTQGWRRFRTADVVNGKKVPIQYYLEAGQTLSGKVVNLFNKPSWNADVFMISLTNDYFMKATKTDSLGKYIMDVSFPDSSCFIFKAIKQKNFGDVEIIPDPDDFAEISAFNPITKKSEIANLDDYFKQSKDKYFNDGGMPVINLKEVTVTAQKNVTNFENYYSGMAEKSVGLEELDKMPGIAILDILSMIPGVSVSGESISIRGSQGLPYISIDDIEVMETSELTYLTSNDVENISVFKGPSAAIFGAKGGNGAIIIMLRKSINLESPKQISIACVYPLGYQKPSEFYVPKYDVDSVYKDSKPDLRTTIYWNPSLFTDSMGNITTGFPTADKDNEYKITLEGISESGEIYHYIGNIQRKNK